MKRRSLSVQCRNPSRSRPLSANVKRLMALARESPENPDVIKIQRTLTARDLIFCDMQGNIFMTAIDLGYDISEFADIYMNSQVAGVIDHSFSEAGADDELTGFLRIPMLLKSPEQIVTVCMWLDEVIARMNPGDNPRMAVANAAKNPDLYTRTDDERQYSYEELVHMYIYAYWLGYIYRYECFQHDESSRMVYGAFPEPFMQETFRQMMPADGEFELADCAQEICRRLDMLLVGKLWKKEGKLPR